MRPRVFPAEDPYITREQVKDMLHASMRPRVFPAEDVVATSTVAQRPMLQ